MKLPQKMEQNAQLVLMDGDLFQLMDHANNVIQMPHFVILLPMVPKLSSPVTTISSWPPRPPLRLPVVKPDLEDSASIKLLMEFVINVITLLVPIYLQEHVSFVTAQMFQLDAQNALTVLLLLIKLPALLAKMVFI